MRLAGLLPRNQPWIGPALLGIFGVLLMAWYGSTLILIVMNGPHGAARSCLEKYAGARSAADTAAVDAEYPAGARPADDKCGLLRRNGTVSRYEASRARGASAEER
ncbi:hypothetical protein FHS01_003697 [Longimicrobium terrae]|uniref:Uncharacterized protein n=1 Tax=Longimicrobium terrae TaxID=1639882 RepID=A0A841H279_9BACT|nr:hypothetical protein [Longimicrobium terrae]MBB6072036.1 hypothetical protein [Longimicrobium terrae]